MIERSRVNPAAYPGSEESRAAQASIEEAKQALQLRSEPPMSAPPMEVGRGCSRRHSLTSVGVLPSGLAISSHEYSSRGSTTSRITGAVMAGSMIR